MTGFAAQRYSCGKRGIWRSQILRLLVLCSLASLGFGCGPNQAQLGLSAAGTAALGTQALDPKAVAALEQKCQQAAPLLATATSPTAPPTVSQTATYGAAYCQQLLASGVPPATTNANTPAWLPEVIGGVQAAAQIASFVLPLI